ncbi:MAG: TIGR03067 domain-containing protein [Gemmataceae bacterium]
MFALILSASALLTAAEGTIPTEALKPLQGKWQLIAQEHGGKKSPPAEVATITLEITGRKMVTREGIDVKEDSRIEKLDARAKPAALDVKITAGPDLDKIIKGIWKRDGERLVICIAEPGKERPTAFGAGEGTGHTLLTFSRPEK